MAGPILLNAIIAPPTMPPIRPKTSFITVSTKSIAPLKLSSFTETPSAIFEIRSNTGANTSCSPYTTFSIIAPSTANAGTITALIN